MPFANRRKQLVLLLNATTNGELHFKEREAAAEEISASFDPKRHGRLFAETLSSDALTDEAREMLIEILALMADEPALTALEAFVASTRRSIRLRNEVLLCLVALGRTKPSTKA